jgi:hypothetical protein
VMATTMTLVEAVEYIRNNEAYAAALAELQEVRAVLSQTADRRYPEHGHCWCRKDLTNANEPHGEFCQRARALMKRLEVRP